MRTHTLLILGWAVADIVLAAVVVLLYTVARRERHRSTPLPSDTP